MSASKDTGETPQSLLVRALGAVLLAAGLGLAFLGPLEIYCFYLFSEGGPFHYPGFGVGSFMFGNIAAQIAGYYALAAMLIPLGYGHLRARRWVKSLAEGLLEAWMVAGPPFIVAFLAVLLSSKEVAPAAALSVAVLLAVAYPVLPWLGRRFYRSPGVERALTYSESRTRWIETVPTRVLALGVLYLLVILVLHVFLLFRGIFPLFGSWATGLQGIALLDASILLLAGLTWGTLGRRRWAWRGGLSYFALLSLSWIVTLSASSWAELLTLLDLPPREIEFLQGVPLEGYHLAILVGLPLGLLVVQIVRARGGFRGF